MLIGKEAVAVKAINKTMQGFSATERYNLLCHLMAVNFYDCASEDVTENIAPDEVEGSIHEMAVDTAFAGMDSDCAAELMQGVMDAFCAEYEFDADNI